MTRLLPLLCDIRTFLCTQPLVSDAEQVYKIHGPKLSNFGSADAKPSIAIQDTALTTAVTADSTALHRFELRLQLLDLSMGLLEILVETIALGNELLLPLAEALLLDLDLFGETLAEGLLFLLELGVVELSGASLAKLASLHLLGAVGLVMQLLGGVNEVEHVGTDQNGSELLEVAVVLVLYLSNAPRVLAALDDAAIASLDVLFRADYGKRHGSH